VFKIIKLMALDMDGTVTQHKSPLDSECMELLSRLSQSIKLLMVCAGGCERVYRQMGEFPVDIYGYYGMQLSTVKDGAFEVIENNTASVDKDLILGYAEIIRREFGFSEYDGQTIEFHDSGMITFPILGTAASLDKKLAYDPYRQKRRQFYGRVKEIFKDYNVFIGGTSSFDIVPKPYCKSYALENCIERYGIERDEVIYFGDDYGLGGNDEDIYKSDIRFIKVDDYREFPKFARSMLL